MQIEYVSRLDGINELAAETLQKSLNKPDKQLFSIL